MFQPSVDPSFPNEARGHRFLAYAGVALAGLILVAGCSSGGATASAGPTGAATRPTTALSPSPAPTVAATYPLQVIDDEGTPITIPSKPQRIVTLTAAATETAFALGLGGLVVATDSASDYPAEAVPLPDVGAFGAVDVEKIVGLHADLVFAGGNGDTPPDGIARLRAVHVPVVVVYAPSVAGVLADVQLVANAAGRTADGVALAASMRHDIDALAAVVQGGPKPRTFYEIDATAAIYGPADKSFLTELLTLAGADPITSGSENSFEISLERLVSANPAVIVLGDAAFGVTLDTVRARPGWGSIAAVKAGDVRPVDDKLITRPGPRLAQGLRSLILAVHPDAKLP